MATSRHMTRVFTASAHRLPSLIPNFLSERLAELGPLGGRHRAARRIEPRDEPLLEAFLLVALLLGAANELAHILARRGVAAVGDLARDEGLHGLGERALVTPRCAPSDSASNSLEYCLPVFASPIALRSPRGFPAGQKPIMNDTNRTIHAPRNCWCPSHLCALRPRSASHKVLPPSRHSEARCAGSTRARKRAMVRSCSSSSRRQNLQAEPTISSSPMQSINTSIGSREH